MVQILRQQCIAERRRLGVRAEMRSCATAFPAWHAAWYLGIVRSAVNSWAICVVEEGFPYVDDPLSLSETVEHAGLDHPPCVPPDTSLRDVLSLLREKRIGSALVCRDERLVGIFTERDALRLMSAQFGQNGADLDRRIDTVMSRNPETARATDTVASAMEKMSRGGYRRLPVVDDAGRPRGVIQVAGIVHFLVQQFPQAVYNLPPAPDQVMQEREGA
jgi:CBS domain-containing protein